MFKHNGYLIETITNTHVGSGDTSYGIVDNMIQRDSRTAFPVIHPSSIKGAIKDHFEQYLAKSNKLPANSTLIKDFTFKAIFGDNDEQSNEQLPEGDLKKINTWIKKTRTPRHGLIKFYEARLLTLPLRSTRKVFHHAICPMAAIDYCDNLIKFNVFKDHTELNNLIAFFKFIKEKLSDKDFVIFSEKNCIIEDYDNGLNMPESQTGMWGVTLQDIGDLTPYEYIKEKISKYFSPQGDKDFIKSLAVFKDEFFSQICQSGLPVIARNKLNDDGTSDNLFYEEILPRRSVLWFLTGEFEFADDSTDPDYKKDRGQFISAFNFFVKKMLTDNIQMGANSSIGYGVTSISKILEGGHSE